MLNNDTYDWLMWEVSRLPDGGLPPDVRTRIDADRMRATDLRVIAPSIPIEWTHDRSMPDRLIAESCRLRSGWRRVAELRINERHVRIVAFGGIGSGPGFAFKDVRISVHGSIVGRAWVGACALGFRGGDDTAVAILRNDLALCVNLTGRINRTWENVALLGRSRDIDAKQEAD